MFWRFDHKLKMTMGSGKAVGGHVQLKKNTAFNKQKPKQEFVEKKTHNCRICDKKFWSMKALSGHMRCHPERTWRGINPPKIVDLTESLTSWSVTAKRRRKAAALEEDQAVDFLMMLARGEKDFAESDDVVEINVVEMRKQDPDESQSEDDGVGDGDEFYRSNDKLKKRKRKKVKLCDLNLMENGENGDIILRQEIEPNGDNFHIEMGNGKLLNFDLNQLPSCFGCCFL